MGLLDDAVPGGNLAKPLLIALGALLVGKMLSPSEAPPTQPTGPQAGGGAAGGGTSAQPGSSGLPEGGLLGGLGSLLEKLQSAGQEGTVKSWVGNGPNAPIEPGQLGSALGQKTISELAQKAGISEQELLAQLSKVLPGIVDKLTPNGRVPNQQQVAALLQR